MHLAVGDHNHPGKALAWDIRHRSIKRGKQPGSLIAGAGLSRACAYHSDVEIGFMAKLVFELRRAPLPWPECGADGLAW